MKKINSIGYGGRIIGLGLVLLAVIPLILKLAVGAIENQLIPLISKISFTMGVVVLLGFSVLLVIELRQDKRLNKHYQSKMNERRALPNNLFECAACGNRQIRPQDTGCPVCGTRFKS